MITSATSRSEARPAGRPAEMEDALNRFIYHPLSSRLALALRPTGVSPNAVSLMSGMMIVAAGFAYTGLSWPQSLLIGFGLHALWHVFDGADGDLARLTGKASPTGELIDGLCDYIGHMILYTILSIALYEQIGHFAWPLVLFAGFSRIAQANHAESQRRTYLWWAYGKPWLKQAQPGEGEKRRRSWFEATFGWTARFYVWLATAMNPDADDVDRAAVRMRSEPGGEERVRRLVKDNSGASLLLQKILAANPRTLMLGLSMAAGTSLYYFVAELVLMNLLLIYSVRHHKAHSRRLAELMAR